MHSVSWRCQGGCVFQYLKSVVLTGVDGQVLHAELEDLYSKLTDYREAMLRGSLGSQVKLPVSQALAA